MTRKLIIHDGDSERELLLIGTIVVGRDQTCHITNLDPLLSRRHAEFVTTAEHVTIRDLGSRNGMLVNGEKVHEQVLVAGDLVQLGHMQLRYVERHSVYTPEARIRSYATTAISMDVATRAAGSTPGAELDDTRADAPHEPAAHERDADLGRTPVQRDPDSTFPRAVADADETRAPAKRHAPPPAPVDHDATFVAGAQPPADLDATVIPGMKAGANLDATFAPGVDRQRLNTPVPPAGGSASMGREAQLVANHDLRVTHATGACLAFFGAAPETLAGQGLGDLVAMSLRNVADGHGPSSLTFVVERSPSDATLKVTVKTGHAAESVS